MHFTFNTGLWFRLLWRRTTDQEDDGSLNLLDKLTVHIAGLVKKVEDSRMVMYVSLMMMSVSLMVMYVSLMRMIHCTCRFC